MNDRISRYSIYNGHKLHSRHNTTGTALTTRLYFSERYYGRRGTALCGRIEMAFDGGTSLRIDWEGRYTHVERAPLTALYKLG